MSAVDCVVYRCGRREEMYLYLVQDADGEGDIGRLPEELLRHTGKLEEVITLSLTPARRLARVDVNEVIAALRDKGYYLQMPPSLKLYI